MSHPLAIQLSDIVAYHSRYTQGFAMKALWQRAWPTLRMHL